MRTIIHAAAIDQPTEYYFRHAGLHPMPATYGQDWTIELQLGRDRQPADIDWNEVIGTARAAGLRLTIDFTPALDDEDPRSWAD